ncbi:MAG: hypothetical protein C4527_13115 [Candidatus Omnitrophota bacterium]|jgi:tetratricopeptide (TPR) repeat protein|nr:MAG: hypothetical protein C4527_13115 [Candidatus Omnitrophota bacterium]
MDKRKSHEDLYEFEIGRFLDLLEQDRNYAFQRYGFTTIYSLPPEKLYQLKNELGWKGRDALDYYNQGTIECQEGKLKDALKHFEKAESMNCDQPELYFNMAVIMEEKDDKANARAYYQKYIDAVEKLDDIPISLQKELDEVREHLKSL